jgi:hypothetical protein
MKSNIAEICKILANIKGCKFASLTYLAKSTKELGRFTVEIGFSYHRAVEKSVVELEILMAENTKLPKEHADKWNKLQVQAADEVMASLKKTLDAHAVGKQNEDYTKKGQYIPFGNGLNVNTTDNTIQLFGLLRSKVVLKEGVYKTVNSAPLTIEKNKIRKMLPVSDFREFALDIGNIAQLKADGETIVVEPDLESFKALGFDLTDTLNQKREMAQDKGQTV